MSEQSDAIFASFVEWLKANTPEGTRLVVKNDLYPEVEICCNGHVEYTAYICCLPPGHEGQCFCRGKNCEFTPDAYL